MSNFVYILKLSINKLLFDLLRVACFEAKPFKIVIVTSTK